MTSRPVRACGARALRGAGGLLLPGLLAGVLTAAGLPGCTVVSVRYGHAVPSAEALALIEPGRTTEAELISALGVPEEYASPNAMAYGRAWEPDRQRADVERELTDRRVFTWLQETRVRSELAILPGLPILGDFLTLFSYTTLVHADERVVVLLDADGTVIAAGRSESEDA